MFGIKVVTMFRIKIVTKDKYPNIDRSIDLEDHAAAEAFCRKVLKDGVKADVSTGVGGAFKEKFLFIPAKGIKYIIMENVNTA